MQQRLLTAADSIASARAALEQQRIELRRERRELQRLESALGDQDKRSALLSPMDEKFKPDDMPDAIGLVSVSGLGL